MTALVPLAMLGWPLAVVALFAVLPPRRAVLAAILAGWLFLPVAKFPVHGLPDYDKRLATSLTVFVVAAAFDGRSLRTVQPAWFDLPVVVLCLAPFASSLHNDLGAYDGLSAVFQQTVIWGIPYLLGRAYLGSLEGLRELAWGMIAGGAAYIPLCWFEFIRGPELHRIVYGYRQQELEQAIRFGGWRPAVFMDHGLMVAVWMTSCCVVAFWLWRTGVPKRAQTWRWPLLVALLAVTTVLLKSVNAWLLLTTGLGSLWLGARMRRPGVFWALIAVVGLYVGVRATGLWDMRSVLPLVSRTMGNDKVRSLAFRFHNEDLLVHRALQRPLLGWGRWGRHLRFDWQLRQMTVADSLWIIVMGQMGWLGLCAVVLLLLLPAALFLVRFRVSRWREPLVAPAAAVMAVLCLYAVDCLANAMVNPVYMLGAGGLVGLCLHAGAAPSVEPAGPSDGAAT